MDELMKDPALSPGTPGISRAFVVDCVREAIEEARGAVLSGSSAGDVSRDALVAGVRARVERLMAPSLRKMINASGTVLHTNIGRAELSLEAAEAAREAAGACNIEYDLAAGKRGERDSHVEELLTRLTGAEAACVVNNNAAAVLLTLNTLALGREVVVSRGELIEIGGSFRLPDIIEKSGCVMREVGTTNRTHPGDYSGAVGPDTALMFKAHTSNYRVVGFTREVPFRDLVEIGREHGLPVVEDLGSGTLVDLTRYGLPPEPVVSDVVRAG
ncbi:MAG TPA: L-seryl-tRNA(Sec) selenium transferase, partial [Gammaproteobacteria bacterium]|nr:L-seryl-tRNA(Sec) selenium transferase [Gammaproteobacteria bacterium]